jgi:hypothetical protein
MNAHSTPPGGWEPDPPKWVAEVRRNIETLHRIEDRITEDIERFIRLRRSVARWAFVGAYLGYLFAFFVALAIRWFWPG